jgi:hypothetical protein
MKYILVIFTFILLGCDTARVYRVKNHPIVDVPGGQGQDKFVRLSRYKGEILIRSKGFNSYTHIQLKIKALSEPISYFPSRVSIKIKGSDVSPSLTDEKIYMMCGKKDISIGTERSINIKADCELTANYTFDSVPYNLYRGTSPSYELIDLGFSSPLKVEFEQYRDFNH